MGGRIVKVSGPLVAAEGLGDIRTADVVRIGQRHLIGEILSIVGERAFIQAYEDTGGLMPGAEVYTTGAPLSVELGPGLLENIFDGVGRPLAETLKLTGDLISRGAEVPTLNRTREWEFTPIATAGDKVTGGSIIGIVNETSAVAHKIMIPHSLAGVIESIGTGTYTVEQVICTIKTPDNEFRDITMMQKWPVRTGRPFLRKLIPVEPLCTGQRMIDTMFPIAKGGVAAAPGSSGAGKTVLMHQLARWSEVDIVVYVGCGERGNEMADMLTDLPERTDRSSGQPRITRTVLIVNTSDMPVMAREASVYTGITIAEYFRDMGYNAVLIIDTVTRWAQALREMSIRLGETPGEDGYPVYLPSHFARFFERTGSFECLGGENRRGSVTAFGAVSLPGGVVDESVSQAMMKSAKAVWAIDATLACARIFPAINRLSSYSQYLDTLKPWYNSNLGLDFVINRNKAIAIIHEETKLEETAARAGRGSLPASDILLLETAKMIREDFLQQNAFADVDNCSAYERQASLLSLILYYFDLCNEALAKGVDDVNLLLDIPAREKIGRAKSIMQFEYDDVVRAIAIETEQQLEAVVLKAQGTKHKAQIVDEVDEHVVSAGDVENEAGIDQSGQDEHAADDLTAESAEKAEDEALGSDAGEDAETKPEVSDAEPVEDVKPEAEASGADLVEDATSGSSEYIEGAGQ